MKSLQKINKFLTENFHGKATAREDDGCLLLEGELDSWDEIVRACSTAAALRKKETRAFIRKMQNESGDRPGGLVNRIQLTNNQDGRFFKQTKNEGLAPQSARPDILVIGGGVVGCAIARELCRYRRADGTPLDIVLAEKEHDLAMHASGRNDGMIHPGIDLSRATWKFFYNSRGKKKYAALCKELGVKFARPGQYLCFTSKMMIPALYASLVHWKLMGIKAQVVLKKELKKREPGLKDDIEAALYFPEAGIVCPFQLTIALGESAVQNGAKILLDTEVLGMEIDNHGQHGQNKNIVSVKTNRGVIEPKVVVNAAGVFADDIAAMAGDQFFSIHPRRGTNSILDKKYARGIVRSIASKMGSQGAHTKGGGLVATAHGNLLVGPDSAETPDKENFATCAASVDAVFAKFKNASPVLAKSQIIAYFSGTRAPTWEEDFVVCKGRRCKNIVHAAGIQSPGLTAAPAIAEDAARFAAELLEELITTNHTNHTNGKQIVKNEKFNPHLKPVPHIAALNDEEREKMIAENPDYGIILCRCEEVSRGEILDSLRRPVPCDTVDGVKRRVRPGMGRCQGGFCGPLVLKLIAEEKNIPLEQVAKSGRGSEILLSKNKAAGL
jgi:glycerol-3-phosphate dehydrogenase